jgi:acyl-CoA thioesterase-1
VKRPPGFPSGRSFAAQAVWRLPPRHGQAAVDAAAARRYKIGMALSLTPGQTFLFIGDSITDVGRREGPEQIGNGYVRLIRDYLLAKDPAAAPRVINMGISGNKVTDLAARWKTDVLDLEPDVVSIFIGINDVWHGLGGRDAGVPLEKYVEMYHVILRQLNAVVPKAKVVLCQPSVIEPPAPEGNAILQPYVRAVNELNREFAASALVPLHAAFVAARKARPDIDWTPDGVHPSPTGHMLIARTWLAETGLL